MKKIVIVLVILLLLIAVGVLMAPARLASSALEKSFPRRPESAGQVEVRLLGAQGTIWDGSGQLLINREPIGNLNWQVQGAALLSLEAAVDWQINGEGFSAQGTAAAKSGSYDLRDLNATIDEQLLRSALAIYDIAPTGALQIEQLDILDIKLNEGRNWPSQLSANGELGWSGGPVRYRLAQKTTDIELPAMIGKISTSETGREPGWPELEVTDQNDGKLLITGRLTPRGSAAIGITKGFTRLAGQPWPGSEPDHAIVLEVEEQLN